jgi:hypothetical protein
VTAARYDDDRDDLAKKSTEIKLLFPDLATEYEPATRC